jgi:hypothetical protein
MTLFLKEFQPDGHKTVSGLVRVSPNADNIETFRNVIPCDSNCGAHTPIYRSHLQFEHEVKRRTKKRTKTPTTF